MKLDSLKPQAAKFRSTSYVESKIYLILIIFASLVIIDLYIYTNYIKVVLSLFIILQHDFSLHYTISICTTCKMCFDVKST